MKTAIKTTAKFNIYHPLKGELNTFCTLDDFVYEKIATVETESLVKAFQACQNDFNESYSKLGRRSTSVGDIISDGENVFMVLGVGFKKIKSKHLLTKELFELDDDTIAMVTKQILESPEDYIS